MTEDNIEEKKEKRKALVNRSSQDFPELALIEDMRSGILIELHSKTLGVERLSKIGLKMRDRILKTKNGLRRSYIN